MTDTEKDELLIELKTDIKYIREWVDEHKKQHASYFYLFVATIVGVFVSLIESFRGRL